MSASPPTEAPTRAQAPGTSASLARWGAFRVGVGGPVGSGKTALIETLVPRLVAEGRSVVVITNDIITREDEQHVKAALAGVLDPDRIEGVQTGTCPHAAVREDPSMNLAVLGELAARYPDADYAFIESGGDNLTLTFSPELVDHSVFVIDVAGGDKVPRKRGIGLVQADLLVINKVDLAPYVGADLEVMARDSRLVRGEGPFLFTDCRHEARHRRGAGASRRSAGRAGRPGSDGRNADRPQRLAGGRPRPQPCRRRLASASLSRPCRLRPHDQATRPPAPGSRSGSAAGPRPARRQATPPRREARTALSSSAPSPSPAAPA